MITKENIISHELIGLDAQIVESTNEQLIGFAGKIVDETKYTFTLSTANGLKIIPKEGNHWQFSFDNQKVVVSGNKIKRRSYERIGVKA